MTMMMIMMDVSKDNPSGELETLGTSTASFQKAMELQKQIFHSQIDQLRSILVTQCKLTGVNPLSQEMAAGALSIKIGKRPRDLLNPKAVKYMQSVFSIKDAISKKEYREIGALFGLTVTQVREYFASQRTRVRKMVRLSREKAIRTSTNKELQDVVSSDADPMLPIDPIPLDSIAPPTAEEAPSCPNQDEVLPGLGESEKHFVENIFSSMCKEETFSGQVKLMEWILQIKNPSVLCWFLTKDGVMILATWLSQAASEEQTSVLSVALKVLSHLPLHKALPVHMSAILQAVNRLRFYRISDISNRARLLLSKWSKMFAKSQPSKKPNGVRSAGAPEIDLRQRIGELIGDDSWQSSADGPAGVLVPLDGNPDDMRKMEAPKLLTASSDDSNKKNILGTSSTHNKERRKILLVEQPGQKTVVKSQQVKAVPASGSQARPITADEIQKAKMRAQFIQGSKRKIEGPKKPLLTNDLLSASEAYLRPKLEAQKKARLLPSKICKTVDSPPPDQKPTSEQKPTFGRKESILEKCRRVEIPWRAPPEVQIHSDWGVGIGENSKEMEAQKVRLRREKETVYHSLQEVPPNPRDPWDIEMDYDDTLTLEIPIEQLPDPNDADTPLDSHAAENHNPGTLSNPAPSTSSQAEPDLELLAVLLKNPELVFALTSGQASGLSSEDTVKLLDLLKSNGGAGLLNGSAAKPEEKQVLEVSLPSPTPHRDVEVSLPSPTPPNRFEVSLPSPTPSCNPSGPSGWASTAPKNPFSRQTVSTQDRFQNGSSTIQSHFPSSAPAISTFSHAPPRASISVPDNQPTRIHPFNNSPFSHPQMHSQQHHHLSVVPEPYTPQHPEDRNREIMLKPRHDYNTLHTTSHANQNVYSNPTVGPGHGWNSQEQRGFYGRLPPDNRVNRYQNSPGFRDPNTWHGSGNRRWHDGDRRR